MLTINFNSLRFFLISSLFFLHLYCVKADIGAPARLAGDFWEKNYEQASDGIDSTVLKIEGVGHFNTITTKAEMPVVIRCFLGSGQLHNQSRLFFQDVASGLGGKVFSYSIDFDDNPDVMEQLMIIFSKVSVGNKTLALANPDLYSFLLSLTHQLMHVLRDGGDVTPFFLFFKNGTLVVPGTIGYTTKAELHAAISEHLMRLEAVAHVQPAQPQFPSAKTQQEHPRRVPLWQKIKGWFSKK